MKLPNTIANFLSQFEHEHLTIHDYKPKKKKKPTKKKKKDDRARN